MMPLDIINMYPFVRVKLIKKALQHYLRNLLAKAKQRIKLGMTMIQFGMKNMLVNFRDKFYVYQGPAKGHDLLEEDVVLAIGGFKLVFLADLVTSFAFEKTAVCFKSALFWEIYRDDVLVVFKGRRKMREIALWLKGFQSKANKLMGSDYLQFTTELWRP
eukprot:4296941-Ditylum_brightwellii.AAC.1